MKTLGFSERGCHATNEDAWQTRLHPADPRCVVCALADGQGGRAGGQEASQLAVRTAVALISTQQPGQLVSASTWETLLRVADRAVRDDREAGFTTLVALAILEDTVVGASSGDSAAVGFAGHERRILTQNQMKNPPVGSGAASFIAFSYRLHAPWKVLTMSDGVWKSVGWQAIMEIAPTLDGRDLIDALYDRGRRPGGGLAQDDFTVVLAEGS